jgi:hypothetical protein
MPKGILERLSEGVVLGDGGCLLELERRGYVQARPFVPEASLRPGAWGATRSGLAFVSASTRAK